MPVFLIVFSNNLPVSFKEVDNYPHEDKVFAHANRSIMYATIVADTRDEARAKAVKIGQQYIVQAGKR